VTLSARQHWFGSPAAAYAHLVPLITVAARKVGYAIGLHGSMKYDLDLVAIPWTDEAGDAEALLAAILDALAWKHDLRAITGPGEKPHGRRAWTIPIGAGLHIDLSVMPRRSS